MKMKLDGNGWLNKIFSLQDMSHSFKMIELDPTVNMHWSVFLSSIYPGNNCKLRQQYITNKAECSTICLSWGLLHDSFIFRFYTKDQGQFCDLLVLRIMKLSFILKMETN